MSRGSFDRPARSDLRADAPDDTIRNDGAMNNTTTSPTTAPVVHVDSLTKQYRSGLAVDTLSFEVPAGQVVGLLGPNGAGKTTAMKMLLGLVQPSSGQATILGAPLSSSDFAHAVRRVGALIESPALYERLSARRNLELQAYALDLPVDHGRIDELLDLVDLVDRGDDKAGSYSLGMKQRLGIAVAMMGSPELVILDEPANGLDPAGIVEIRNLLRRLPAMGTTVLVSSHQLAEVQQACDRLVVLADGRLIAQGTTEEILRGYQGSDFTIRLDATATERAVELLTQQGLSTVCNSTTELAVTLPDGWTGRDLNRTLANDGLYADELIHRTVSLEEAFLAMTAPDLVDLPSATAAGSRPNDSSPQTTTQDKELVNVTR